MISHSKAHPPGPRSRLIYDLPAELRRELDGRIVESGFAQYEQHRQWLATAGHHVGVATVKRYGAQLRQLDRIRLATREATALVDSTKDDGQLADASVRLAQVAIYELLQAADERDMKAVAAASRAVADLARASKSLREERRRTIAEAAEAATTTARNRGVTRTVEQAIRAAIEQLA